MIAKLCLWFQAIVSIHILSLNKSFGRLWISVSHQMTQHLQVRRTNQFQFSIEQLKIKPENRTTYDNSM